MDSRQDSNIAEPGAEPVGTTQRLRANSVGGFALTFMVVACAAPLTVVVGMPGLLWGVAGNSAPAAAFLVAGIILLLFAVGYTAMSRFLSGPGGFAVYVDRAFGKNASGATSFVGLVGYGSFLLALVGFLGYLCAPQFEISLGLSMPWWAWALVVVAMIGVLGYLNIDLSAKVLSILLVAEILITLVMDIGILVQGGESGMDMTGWSPGGLFAAAPAITILFAVSCYVGFESTTLYGEEVRERTRTVPRATYAAVLLITVFYCLTFWAMGIGYGNKATEAATNSPGTFTLDLTSRFVGGFATEVMGWLVLTSVLAASLAFHNGLSRYIFSLGRSGIVPAKLGEAHGRHGSPHLASLTASIATLVGIIGYALFNADPYLQIYAVWIAVGTVAMLLLYISGGISVLSFLRSRSESLSAWQAIVAPAVSSLCMVGILVAAIWNYGTVTGSTNQLVNLMWILAPGAAAVGYLLARRHYKAHPDSQGPSGLRESEGP